MLLIIVVKPGKFPPWSSPRPWGMTAGGSSPTPCSPATAGSWPQSGTPGPRCSPTHGSCSKRRGSLPTPSPGHIGGSGYGDATPTASPTPGGSLRPGYPAGLRRGLQDHPRYLSRIRQVLPSPSGRPGGRGEIYQELGFISRPNQPPTPKATIAKMSGTKATWKCLHRGCFTAQAQHHTGPAAQHQCHCHHHANIDIVFPSQQRDVAVVYFGRHFLVSKLGIG